VATVSTVEAARCAGHPGRPAHDHCPRCGRLRCDADAVAYQGTGCEICHLDRHRLAPKPLELAVRVGLAGVVAAAIGGWIAKEYVLVHIFSLVVPGLVGFAGAGLASGAVAGSGRTGGWFAVAAGAVAGVLGTGLGFRLDAGGGQNLLHPFSIVGAPYLCAVAGAALWPVVLGMPKTRRDS
jgi:hypothetical protein